MNELTVALQLAGERTRTAISALEEVGEKEIALDELAAAIGVLRAGIAAARANETAPTLPPLVHPHLGLPTELYPYRDETGELLYVVGRFEPKDFRQARLVEGRWVWNLNGARRVLYQLAKVQAHVAQNKRDPIYIVEGEKDVEAIERAGGSATTNPQGAGKWSDDLSEQLQGARRVVIVADNDEPGRAHAQAVAASLARFGIVPELASPAEGKDVSDHLAAGRTLNEFEPIELDDAIGAERAPDSWTPLDLTADRYAKPSEPPTIAGLAYRALRHALSGPPESAKTIFAFILALEHHRATGERFAYISFEIDAVATRRLLEDLGASKDELRACYYVEPETKPTADNVGEMLAAGVTLAIIDAAAGAYGISGLDDNKRTDAETFAREWIRPLWTAGATTLLIDHVTKAIKTRGSYAIGSERKLGQVDVHLGLEMVTPLHRGGDGLVHINTHKDRPGHLPRPRAADLHLRSAPNGRIAYTIQQAEPGSDDRGGFRPTVLMERVLAYLRKQGEPAARSAIEKAVRGKREYVRLAIDLLAAEGEIVERSGPRGARLYELASPRPRPEPKSDAADDLAPTSPPAQTHNKAKSATSPRLAPTSPQSAGPDLAPSPPSLQGEGEGRGEVNEDEIDRLDSLREEMDL